MHRKKGLDFAFKDPAVLRILRGHLCRVHAKGVVLCERACFCLLSAFYNSHPF